MIDEVETGGPAFPVEVPGEYYSLTYEGMTIRDYFAGQALAGFLANPNDQTTYDEAAKSAYKYADAMLIARDGKR